MSQPIAIPEQDIQDLRADVQDAIRAAGLAALVVDVAPGPYGHSAAGLQLLDALELGGACLLATRRALTGRIAADRRTGFAAGVLSDEEQRFASLLAVHVGCSEALAAAGVEAERLPPAGKTLPLDEHRSVFTAGERELLANWLEDLARYLTFYRGHRDGGLRLDGVDRLRACAGGYLALAAATAARLGDDGEYAPTRTALAELGLHARGATYHGFAREAAVPVEEERELLPVWPADIVGNQEVLDAGLDLARAVAGYDLARGENPRKLRNPVLFMLGAPGCGKTVTAHAIGNFFLDLCQRHEIPARFRIIRRTDWASHYQNRSANELLRIFKDEIFDFEGVAGCYWPDIDTAFAAREDPGIRAEEKAILGTLFGLLDGTVGPRNGKWFLIADANYLSMDPAALSRLSQDPHYAKGPVSADDFVVMLRDKKLGKVKEQLVLSDADWAAFGARCVDAKLSGRAVDNLAGKLLAEIEDVDVPEHFYSLSFDDKQKLLAEGRKRVDGPHIQALVDRYIAFEKEAEERALAERFQRRVAEIRESLAARVAALGVGDGGGDSA
jgi:hypothetical protein